MVLRQRGDAGGDAAAPAAADTDLRVDVAAGAVRLRDGEHLVGEALPGVVDVEPPPAVDLATAVAATQRYAGFAGHPFRRCFVCGPDREPPDGLGLRPGPVGPDAVAAVWTPADRDRSTVWAALDCPGGWAEDLAGRPALRGRMALRLHAEPEPGVPHVVQGWAVGRDGRKTSTVVSLRTPRRRAAGRHDADLGGGRPQRAGSAVTSRTS